MDLAPFGLRKRPFRPTPDTEFYYPATAHEGAMAEIARALGDDESLILLTGAPGTGKTLLLHRILETLPEDLHTVFLTNPRCDTRAELLQAICFEMSLPYRGKSEQELRLTVTEALLTEFQNGGCTLIIVDEAQYLSGDLLEELRLLTNLEGKQGKAVQVLLAAQPELLKLLQSPALGLIRQRLSTRTFLESLEPEESHDFLKHQVRVAGGTPEKLFDEEGLQILAEVSKGVPRLLNQVAAAALNLAAAMKSRNIDAEAALEAATRLGLEIPEDEPEQQTFAPAAADSDDEVAAITVEEPPPLAREMLLQATVPFTQPTDGPRVLIYSGQPTGTPLERIEELLKMRRQQGT